MTLACYGALEIVAVIIIIIISLLSSTCESHVMGSGALSPGC